MTSWECYHCGRFFDWEKTPDECPNCHSSSTFWLEASEPVAAKDVKDRLRRIPIFLGLDDKSLADMARAFREATFSTGAAIMREGEQSSSFLILTEGRAEVRQGGRFIATLQPYEFFGELAALGIQRRRTADVIANGQCKCLVAIQPELHRVLSSHPSVSTLILGEIRNRYEPEDESPDPARP